MLFRRITEHVKAQNWFAVALDFFIVVVGVVIGIQVANWNDARADRVQESRVTERLHGEVAALIDARVGRRRFAGFVQTGLEEAAQTLFNSAGDGALSSTACQAILLSHVYASQPDELPVIEELIATGRIDLITNGETKRALLDFVRARDHGRTTLQSVGRDIQRLSLRFPNLIVVALVPEGQSPGLVPEVTCDAAAMRADQGFLNTFIGNRAIHAEYFAKHFDAVDAPLAALSKELEKTSGRPSSGGKAKQ